MENLGTIIYWVSTTIVIMCWLFSVRHFKEISIFSLFASTIYMATAVLWEFQILGGSYGTLSDAMYDIALAVGAICAVRSFLVKNNNTCIDRECKNRKTVR